jgi:branched-chain amino acid transport system ATP-binding protein
MKIELIDVTVRYGSIIALSNCDLVIGSDEAVAVIGPNGNGKSSLLKAIAGLASFDGHIRVDGQEPSRRTARSSWAVRRGVVLVPERRALFPRMTVRDNILLGCYAFTRRLSTRLRDQVMAETLDLFPELETKLNSDAGTLSGGQQQMVAIARGLASRPSVLMLDEPSLGLAEIVVHKLYDTLSTLRTEGRGLVVAEESPVNAIRLCDKVVSVERGTVAVAPAPVRSEMIP